MELTFQEIVKLVLDITSMSIRMVEPCILDSGKLSMLNNPKQQEEIYFGTLSGILGSQGNLSVTNNIGTVYNTNFYGVDETTTGTNMGTGVVNFPNQLFSTVDIVDTPNNQIYFSGYRFKLV